MALVSALALVGCRDDAGGEEDGGGTGDDGGPDDSIDDADDGDEDAADSDSGDDGEPSACDDAINVAIAPLRRLTREQYGNAVRDLLALTADVEALDGDEKAGPFYANVTAPVSSVLVEQHRTLAEDLAIEAVGQMAIDYIEHATKIPELFPFGDDEVRDAMVDETRRFSTGVVLQGDGRLETLLSADFTYIDGPLFEIYGIEEPPGHSVGEPVALDPDERAGLLTQLGFLSAHAYPDQSGPIQRGVEVRTNLLCTPPPPPPPGINAIPPEFDPDATTREIFEMHTADPACAGCHELIDGIGLGFEGYDAVGAYRETQNGQPVDQTGTVIGTSDINGDFDGAVELAHMLATSEDVRSCVARQWFRYAFARIEDTEQDACSLETIDSVFAESDYNVRELMIALVQTDAFRCRLAD